MSNRITEIDKQHPINNKYSTQNTNIGVNEHNTVLEYINDTLM